MHIKLKPRHVEGTNAALTAITRSAPRGRYFHLPELAPAFRTDTPPAPKPFLPHGVTAPRAVVRRGL